jgi:hypothetical protein
MASSAGCRKQEECRRKNVEGRMQKEECRRKNEPANKQRQFNTPAFFILHSSFRFFSNLPAD